MGKPVHQNLGEEMKMAECLVDVPSYLPALSSAAKEMFNDPNLCETLDSEIRRQMKLIDGYIPGDDVLGDEGYGARLGHKWLAKSLRVKFRDVIPGVRSLWRGRSIRFSSFPNGKCVSVYTCDTPLLRNLCAEYNHRKRLHFIDVPLALLAGRSSEEYWLEVVQRFPSDTVFGAKDQMKWVQSELANLEGKSHE